MRPLDSGANEQLNCLKYSLTYIMARSREDKELSLTLLPYSHF